MSLSGSGGGNGGAGMGGQSITDRMNAARYAIAGQALARVVCKATTEEALGPKKKHLDYLLQCTHEPNVSIPSLANLLIERTTNGSWVVVFKSLITVHHLMCYGNERFTQFLATSNCTFNLHNFMDKSTNGGIEMSTFIRRYSKYINAKAVAYRSVGADFAKMKRTPQTNNPYSSSSSSSPPPPNPSSINSMSSDSSSLRLMSGDRILKVLPTLQGLVDGLLEFDAHPRDLNNGVVNAAFTLLYRDLIRLFACFNDGIINLLEKFFSFKGKKECREALELYKRFLVRMDRVKDFLKTAEAVGIDKGEIPDLTRAPSSLLEALEAHCLQMEGKDPLNAHLSTSSSSSLVGASKGVTSSTGRIHHETARDKEDAFKKALEEEAQLLSKFEREKRLKQQSASPSTMGSSSRTSPSTITTNNSNSAAAARLLSGFSSNGSSTATASSSSSSDTKGIPTSMSDPDFNPFLFGDDPVEDINGSPFTSTGLASSSSGSAPSNNKKVKEDILALFESNSASMNSMNAAFGPGPFSPFGPHHVMQPQMQHPPPAPNTHGNPFNPFLTSAVPQAQMNQMAHGHHFNVRPGHPQHHGGPMMGPPFSFPGGPGGVGHSMAPGPNSNGGAFEANFASAFPSSSALTSGTNNGSTSGTSTSTTNTTSSNNNSLFAQFQNPNSSSINDFSLI